MILYVQVKISMDKLQRDKKSEKRQMFYRKWANSLNLSNGE